MRCVSLILFVRVSFFFVGMLHGQQPESAAESVLRQPPVVSIAESGEQLIHRSGFYGSAGVLIAPPIVFEAGAKGQSWDTAALPPIPAPWVTLGFRRDNDVSWQMSFLLVPLIDSRSSILSQPFYLSTTGFDIDRISTNRSPWEEFDLRWQVGLRIVGVGVNGIPIPFALGPHSGLRVERPLRGNLFLQTWADVGVLPSLFNGTPLVDLRGEIGLLWRSPRRPGLSASVGLFNEVVGFGFAGGFMTPGIKTMLSWNF